MSIQVIKQGILDTVQDVGRYGYQHWGINPGGAADKVSYAIANMLVGNDLNEGVIEFHFPASTIQFNNDALIALTGADFSACINNTPVALNKPVFVGTGSLLTFIKLQRGGCCYLAIQGGFNIPGWLGSVSTNIKAGVGGYKGRRLEAGDVIAFNKIYNYAGLLNGGACFQLPWYAAFPGMFPKQATLRTCAGKEYELLCGASKDLLIHSPFTVTNDTDRMGSRLSGIPLKVDMAESLVSTGVTAGTIQLLPSGQLLILGAEHQTTGGYPRIAHICSADMHLVAQLQPHDTIQLSIIDITEAEELLLHQYQYLQQLQIACTLRLDEFFTAYAKH